MVRLNLQTQTKQTFFQRILPPFFTTQPNLPLISPPTLHINPFCLVAVVTNARPRPPPVLARSKPGLDIFLVRFLPAGPGQPRCGGGLSPASQGEKLDCVGLGAAGGLKPNSRPVVRQPAAAAGRALADPTRQKVIEAEYVGEGATSATALRSSSVSVDA